jgi:hypothetical protein
MRYEKPENESGPRTFVPENWHQKKSINRHVAFILTRVPYELSVLLNSHKVTCTSLLSSLESSRFFSIDRQVSDTDSEDDNEIESSTTIEETRRSPPIITWKHVWPVSETRHTLSDSPFANLPTEILIQIFRLLSVHDMENISLVCRYFKVISDHDDIWRSKCNRK